jgi:branched-chain amino acid transport system ATP-binding protein
MSNLLTLTNLSKSFGSLQVIEGFDMHLEDGEALGIIGPNGAGKSTLFNLITGSLSADTGSISFDGKDLTGMPAHVRCRAGIGRSYQIPHPFGGMTVFENLLVGAAFGGGEKEEESYEHCAQLLKRTGLIGKANTLAGSLTLLERKRLEMARALATKPKVLLLDEIAGGLTEHEVKALVETINEIHAQGTSIVWIEHIVHALMSVVDRLVVINFGQKLDDGDPETVFNSPEVQQIYMGISIE